MQAHPESISTDFTLSQLFQNFLFACSCSVGGEVGQPLSSYGFADDV
jgi:hypothetical protein